MKIVHVMMCGPVTDGWSYQDNLLTKYHKKMGHDVTIITSQWIWGSDGVLERFDKTGYVNDDGVKVLRLPIKGNLPFAYKFKRYIGLYDSLEAEKPDVIFIHNVSFCDVSVVARYLKRHGNVIAYADSHSDFSNSGTNRLAKNVLHKIIWRRKAKKIEPYIRRFYGVLPARVDFLVDIYKIPEEKTELLFLGADDEKVAAVDRERFRRFLEDKYGIAQTDFLIVTGGKIDSAKRQTLELMQAVKSLGITEIKLLVFGSVEAKLKEKLESYLDCRQITYIGWIDASESYNYFGAADLVVFPGRHSVFWEQVVAQGIPLVCKYWDGTTHVNTDRNVLFLYNDSADEIKNVITRFFDDKDFYNEMKQNAQSARSKFLYSVVAEKSLQS